MVADMETAPRPDEAFDAAQQVLELERAEAAPYVVYPQYPRWLTWVYPLSVGAYFAILIGAGGYRDQHFLFILTMALLVVAAAAGFGALAALRGTWPRLSKTAPPEIRAEQRRFLVAAVVVGLGLLVVTWQRGTVTGAATALVVVSGGVAWYEARYARAARVVRERLGMPQHGEAAS